MGELREEINRKCLLMLQRNEGLTRDNAILAFFREMDQNNDGVVSAKELRSSLTHLNIYIRPHTFTNLFRILDPDRSGYIELAEFTDFLDQGENYQPQPGDRTRRKSVSENSTDSTRAVRDAALVTTAS